MPASGEAAQHGFRETITERTHAYRDAWTRMSEMGLGSTSSLPVVKNSNS
jgi:hypothetical protein